MGSRYPLPRGFGIYQDRDERIQLMQKYARDRGWHVQAWPRRRDDDAYSGPPDPTMFPNFEFTRGREMFRLHPADFDAPDFAARFTELVGDAPGFVPRKAIGSA